MSGQAAQAFLARLRSDEAFAQRLADLHADPAAVQAVLAAEGVDATPEEIREAFLEEFGSELTEEQLAAVAGGLDSLEAGAIAAGVGVVVYVGLLAAAGAAAAI